MMLSQIQAKKSVATEEKTPTDMLMGCHARIRHFSTMAVRLSEAVNAPAEEITRAAESIYRYFTVALPLHEQDENFSLHPRLKKAANLPASTSETSLLRELAGPAADAMVEQHESIDQLVERLLPLWTILRASPERIAELAPEMSQTAKALSEIFDAHLKLEEETVFPAMEQLLSEEQLQELLAEMKARRQ